MLSLLDIQSLDTKAFIAIAPRWLKVVCSILVIPAGCALLVALLLLIPVLAVVWAWMWATANLAARRKAR